MWARRARVQTLRGGETYARMRVAATLTMRALVP